MLRVVTMASDAPANLHIVWSPDSNSMTSRHSTAAPILAMLAIGLAMLGSYVGGYFWLGERHDLKGTYPGLPIVMRQYPQQWQSAIYQPLGRVEQWILGIDVMVTSEADPADESGWRFPPRRNHPGESNAQIPGSPTR
jgi:hypothetical protein